MNGCNVYKRFRKSEEYNAGSLYLVLLGNLNETGYDILLKTPTDKYNEKVYLQVKILFDLREQIVKILVNERIIENDSDQSDIEYEESIAQRPKLRKQKLDETKEKEQNINNELLKEYFDYESPSKMYDILSDKKNTGEHNTRTNLINNDFIGLKKTSKMRPKMI